MLMTERSPASKHKEYYLKDGDLFILVENTLFRIHKHFLLSSPYFLERVGKGGVGLTKQNPLMVDHITAISFSRLVWVFYDETFERNATGEKWFDIFLLAEKLEMKWVQKLAVTKLNASSLETDPIAKISVQERCGMPRAWAKDAYIQVCERACPLGEEEGVQIGPRACVLIASLREEVARRGSCGQHEYIEERAETLLDAEMLGKSEPSKSALPSDYEIDIDGGNVDILVDDKLFRVHRYFLSLHSPVIRELLSSTTPGADKQCECDSDDLSAGIISLPNISSAEFSWILWMFYDETFTLKAPPSQWSAIRAIADRYKMLQVSVYAIKQMGGQLDLVERVLSIERYGINDEWATDTWNKIYERQNPITQEEGERLGPSLWAAITKNREEFLRRRLTPASSKSSSLSNLQPSPPTAASKKNRRV